jgi:general secretion pathway protein D
MTTILHARVVQLAVIALALATGPATAQDDGTRVQFRLENASIETVVQHLSERLGVEVEIQAEAKDRLAGKKLTAVSERGLPASRAIDFLNSVLAEHKVAAVRIKDTVKIMTMEKAQKETFLIGYGNDPEQIPLGDEVITHIFPLQYITAEDVKKELGEMMNESGKLLYNARSNSLVITDTATNVRRFLTTVHKLDQQTFKGVTVKRFKLENATAADVARIVGEVFAPPGSGSAASGRNDRNRQGGWAGMIQQFMGGRGQQQQAAQASPLAEVRTSVEERTNTVVVSAATELMPQIEALVMDLDKEQVPEPVTRVFPIRNADAKNVAQILTQLFAPTNRQARTPTTNNQNQNPFARMFGGGGFGGQGGNQRGGGGNRATGGAGARSRTGRAADIGAAAPGFALPAALQDDGAAVVPVPVPGPQEGGAAAPGGEGGVSGTVDVQPDADSNSVVVRTDPANLEAIRRIIGELDQVRAQVLVKCFICEVTLDDESSLGVEWDWNDSLHVRKDPGTGQASSNFDLTSSARSVGFQYQLLSENIDLFVQGLRKNGKLKVLSAPRILALDNEQAEINVGRSVPRVTNTRITQDGQTLNTVEYRDIGIILQVTPHVNTDGQVRLEIAPEVSEVAPQSEAVQITEGLTSPVFVTTTATTTVSVRNNQTVVIGGLIRDRWSKSESRVPVLGDIPLLGLLFRDELVEKTRTELMIFLTPVVITKPHDLELLTREEVLALDLISHAFFERHVLRDGVPSAAKRLMVLRKESPDQDE